MKRLHNYSRASVYRLQKLMREKDIHNSSRERHSSSSESDEEVIRPKRGLFDRNVGQGRGSTHGDDSDDVDNIGDASESLDSDGSSNEAHEVVLEEPQVHHLNDNLPFDFGRPAVEVDVNRSPPREDHAEQIQEDNGSIAEEEAGSDNEADLDHRSEDDADGDNGEEENEDADGEAPEEDYGWDLDDDLPIYALAPITVGESMAAILAFHLKYNLPQTALSDLLELIGLHCQQEGNRFPKSLYHFKKFFANLEFKIVRHYYCSVCFKECPSAETICETHNKGNDYFIQIPVSPQLKALYKRPAFREMLHHKVNRRKFNVNNYEDIYDGDVYKKLSEPGEILSDPENISLMWYTDGVSIFKSAKSELWPFYLTINELPYNERSKISNALLAGVWFGKNKPPPATFLKPIQADLLRLRNGVDLSWGNNPVHHMRVKAIVMCGTADLPAKALFLNFKNHNAHHGCAKCLIQTRNIRRGLNVYPYRDNLVLRTNHGTAEHAREALALAGRGGASVDVLGVKGPSILLNFVYKHVETSAIDVMHSVFLGITKALLTMWFDSKFSDSIFSLRNYTALVNRRLSAISPPSFVQRLSRTLDDIKYWKGHELKTFLFYYSLPVVGDLLPDLHADHHKLLVLGLYLLNQRSVSERDINVSGEVLKEYVGLFEDLYGLENMTCNLHQLLHLADVVRKFGPLWVTSCFPYEDLNGKLKKLVKGSRYADLQVCSGVSMLMKFAELTKNIPEDGRASLFIKALRDPQRRLSTVNIFGRFDIVGKVTKRRTICPAMREALNGSGAFGENLFEFHRLMKYSVLMRSEVYEEKGMKTQSTCVKYHEGPREHFGFINRFVRVSNCNCQHFCGCESSYFAIIRKCATSTNFQVIDVFDEDEPLRFLCTIREVAQGFVAVPVRNLVCVCFVVDVADRGVKYVIEPVNMIECE